MGKPDLHSAFVESEFTRRLGEEKEGGNCESTRTRGVVLIGVNADGFFVML
jgi:hypothetical protein